LSIAPVLISFTIGNRIVIVSNPLSSLDEQQKQQDCFID